MSDSYVHSSTNGSTNYLVDHSTNTSTLQSNSRSHNNRTLNDQCVLPPGSVTVRMQVNMNTHASLDKLTPLTNSEQQLGPTSKLMTNGSGSQYTQPLKAPHGGRALLHPLSSLTSITTEDRALETAVGDIQNRIQNLELFGDTLLQTVSDKFSQLDQDVSAIKHHQAQIKAEVRANFKAVANKQEKLIATSQSLARGQISMGDAINHVAMNQKQMGETLKQARRVRTATSFMRACANFVPLVGGAISGVIDAGESVAQLASEGFKAFVGSAIENVEECQLLARDLAQLANDADDAVEEIDFFSEEVTQEQVVESLKGLVTTGGEKIKDIIFTKLNESLKDRSKTTTYITHMIARHAEGNDLLNSSDLLAVNTKALDRSKKVDEQSFNKILGRIQYCPEHLDSDLLEQFNEWIEAAPDINRVFTTDYGKEATALDFAAHYGRYELARALVLHDAESASGQSSDCLLAEALRNSGCYGDDGQAFDC